MKNLLTIAGSDSSGGAGIQADLKTFAANGGYGMSVITAVTAQNTTGVSAVHNIPPEIVIAQIDAVFNDINVDGVKIGMLSTADIANAVADAMEVYKPRILIVDPVMVSTSGSKLLSDEAVEVIKKYAPAVADTPEDSTYMNQTLFRIFKDDYPKIMKDVLAELEQISY